MGYHHKRDSCAKETREILDNILHMKKSEYAVLDSSDTLSSSKPSEQKDSDANPLPGETVDEEGALEDMETYEPTQEMDFEVDEIKDCLEKKKKRRNYIEFRSDYEKD